jgi:hypothetical protein|tara:strand:+ start:548 stop:766 length:219 start_codon:yes stop_codon:yes gene_type:complete
MDKLDYKEHMGRLISENSKVKEKIKEAIRILNSHNHFDSQSKSWAIDRCINFLETNFDIEDERIEQGWSGEL